MIERKWTSLYEIYTTFPAVPEVSIKIYILKLLSENFLRISGATPQLEHEKSELFKNQITTNNSDEILTNINQLKLLKDSSILSDRHLNFKKRFITAQCFLKNKRFDISNKNLHLISSISQFIYNSFKSSSFDNYCNWSDEIKPSFYSKYDQTLVPLKDLFDPESGLISPNKISKEYKRASQKQINKLESLISKRYENNSLHHITISDDDFQDLQEISSAHNQKLDQMSCIIQWDGKRIHKFKGLHNGGVELSGRFSYNSDSIKDFRKKTLDNLKTKYEGFIFAEIDLELSLIHI